MVTIRISNFALNAWTLLFDNHDCLHARITHLDEMCVTLTGVKRINVSRGAIEWVALRKHRQVMFRK